jgi:hypothetical protein
MQPKYTTHIFTFIEELSALLFSAFRTTPVQYMCNFAYDCKANFPFFSDDELRKTVLYLNKR